MTETRTFYYTDKLDTPTSTAVSNLWYSADTRELFVKFNSGNIAGYSHFDPGYWQNVRDAYHRGNSIGRLVSTQIKGMFPGVCGDILPTPKNPVASREEVRETYSDTAESIPGDSPAFYDFEVEVTSVRTVKIRAISVETARNTVLSSIDHDSGVTTVTAVTQYFDN